jgi:hypothetical protein
VNYDFGAVHITGIAKDVNNLIGRTDCYCPWSQFSNVAGGIVRVKDEHKILMMVNNGWRLIIVNPNLIIMRLCQPEEIHCHLCF